MAMVANQLQPVLVYSQPYGVTLGLLCFLHFIAYGEQVLLVQLLFNGHSSSVFFFPILNVSALGKKLYEAIVCFSSCLFTRHVLRYFF